MHTRGEHVLAGSVLIVDVLRVVVIVLPWDHRFVVNYKRRADKTFAYEIQIMAANFDDFVTVDHLPKRLLFETRNSSR